MRLFVLLALTSTCFAQSVFDVATVKEVIDFVPGPNSEKIVANPGSLAMHNVRLRACIKWAYGLKDYQIAGPSWMGAPGWSGRDVARYEVLAKATDGTPVPEVKLMLQKLLAERFKLALHSESREMAVLLLTAAKPASGLKPSADQNAEGRISPGPDGSVQFLNSTISELAEMLSGPLQTPILDRTGLEGRFDFTLRNPPGSREDVFATVSEALRQQFGLKLERQKVAVDLLIVDSAQRKPVEN
jgi:uncharacterized protein (TIGR03435 family)